MKKTLCLMMALILLLLTSVSVAATLTETGAGCRLNFVKSGIPGGMRFDVYTGPGRDYYRAANGKAAVSTNGDVFVAGAENGWILIMYKTSSGNRVGYIKRSEVNYNILRTAINFEYRRVTVNACELTDDPISASSTLARLDDGEKVTYLASYTSRNYNEWAYVEVYAGNTPLRGFIPADCVR